MYTQRRCERGVRGNQFIMSNDKPCKPRQKMESNQMNKSEIR